MNQTGNATIGEFLNEMRVLVDPFEFSYFTTLGRDEWGRAKQLARSSMSALNGTSYYDYMKSHGPIEKAGEFVFKKFLDYNCRLPYDSAVSISARTNDPYSSSFRVAGYTIDVHTRMLKRGNQPQVSYPMLNTQRFKFMVPEIGLCRGADIYVFCGYDIDSHIGYAFGWTTAQVMAEVPLTTEIRYNAKCLDVYKAYPMHALLGSLSTTD